MPSLKDLTAKLKAVPIPGYISFVLSHWRAIFFCACIIVAYLGFKVMSYKIDHLEQQNAQLTTLVATLNQQVAAQSKALAAQTKSIQDLGALQKQIEQEIAVAQAAIDKQRAAFQSDLTKFLKQPPPKTAKEQVDLILEDARTMTGAKQ